ncbi:MAG: hypothetical protein AVDCRST_MAG64-2423 [uncultured Phycisphaerae bacterium]|uniref:SnoaL-like domain-containing protein n=1 Tax=uncultured Phycisphaerae bacterium TaxID=904963 RepID=A0A6J4PCE9_9BACT|nr:MAG: hypothetical protein AVDCRST_MAG64-2423 [uncultured Phycisphaerae bacterium]
MSQLTMTGQPHAVIDEPASPPARDDEAAIRATIAAWSRALEARDPDGLTANHAADAVLYDVKPPYKLEGVAAIRRTWAACLPYFPASFRSEHRDLRIAVSGDVAFCHGLHHIRPLDEPTHPAGRSWIRVTACYRRIDGRWQVVHEHVSVPFDCATGQVAPIFDPDEASASRV